MAASVFWKNGSFTVRVLQEMSGVCVDTKPRGIEAICIVSDDKGPPHLSLCSWQCKHLVVASERDDSNFGCTLSSQMMMEVNQMLTKSMPRDRTFA